jgi:hypothetical protein
MTFANHQERQLMQRLRGAGWVKASALPSEPASCKSCYKKAGSKQNRVRNRDPLWADRKGFGGQEAAHPNPTEKATVLEWEMISLVDAKARD